MSGDQSRAGGRASLASLDSAAFASTRLTARPSPRSARPAARSGSMAWRVVAVRRSVQPRPADIALASPALGRSPLPVTPSSRPARALSLAREPVRPSRSVRLDPFGLARRTLRPGAILARRQAWTACPLAFRAWPGLMRPARVEAGGRASLSRLDGVAFASIRAAGQPSPRSVRLDPGAWRARLGARRAGRVEASGRASLSCPARFRLRLDPQSGRTAREAWRVAVVWRVGRAHATAIEAAASLPRLDGAAFASIRAAFASIRAAGWPSPRCGRRTLAHDRLTVPPSHHPAVQPRSMPAMRA